MDGTTDTGNVEDELIAIFYCMRDDATQQINTCSHFLSLHSPPQANASRLLQCVGEALQFLSIENVLDTDSMLSVEGKPVLVGVGQTVRP